MIEVMRVYFLRVIVVKGLDGLRIRRFNMIEVMRVYFLRVIVVKGLVFQVSFFKLFQIIGLFK